MRELCGAVLLAGLLAPALGPADTLGFAWDNDLFLGDRKSVV